MALQLEYSAAIEFRFSGNLEDGVVEGIACKYGVVDTYASTFTPTTFRGLAGLSVPMLWAHDTREVIGSWTSLRSTAEGLFSSGKLNLEVQRAREVRALLLAGDVKGLSVGINTLKNEMRGGVRAITLAKLNEVSFTAFPSVPGSGVTGVRSSDDRIGAAIRLLQAARAASRAFT